MVRYEIIVGLGQTLTGAMISPATRQTMIMGIKQFLAQNVSGYTLYTTEGGWQNHGGEIVEEPGVCIIIWSEVHNNHHLKNVARSIARIALQSCVLFTSVTGSVETIPGNISEASQ